MDWIDEVLKGGPTTILAVCLFLLILLFYSLWKVGVISIGGKKGSDDEEGNGTSTQLSKAWVERAEGNFRSLHDLRGKSQEHLFRIDAVERGLREADAKLDEHVEDSNKFHSEISKAVVRLEAQQSDRDARLERIENKIDTILQRSPR